MAGSVHGFSLGVYLPCGAENEYTRVVGVRLKVCMHRLDEYLGRFYIIGKTRG